MLNKILNFNFFTITLYQEIKNRFLRMNTSSFHPIIIFYFYIILFLIFITMKANMNNTYRRFMENSTISEIINIFLPKNNPSLHSIIIFYFYFIFNFITL